MEKNVVYYIFKFMEFQRVKENYRHPIFFVQTFPIPKWKWDVVTIDFITTFIRTTRKYDSIMVVVDKLTKFIHCIPIKMTHKEANIA
jgi:hypothetical protein